MDPERVAPDIYCLDTHLMGIPGACSAYVVDAAEPLLVDAGDANSPDHLLNGLDALGIAPADLDHLLVSHVHLDHAGGAGVLQWLG
ncbi:MBL fold metallo-hydrolase [Halorarius litoreus]|uniref:MBL fold metallo-hydrolase n=1 Tax=Halorarius litoreus TaxID=2962676 RepID=UPI0020CD478F|nr:MBL fold metallo-hydrolase [Halorarius litoreus]